MLYIMFIILCFVFFPPYDRDLWCYFELLKFSWSHSTLFPCHQTELVSLALIPPVSAEEKPSLLICSCMLHVLCVCIFVLFILTFLGCVEGNILSYFFPASSKSSWTGEKFGLQITEGIVTVELSRLQHMERCEWLPK